VFLGYLFVISAPSGAGKSSLVNALRQKNPHLALSVSHTTRRPRGQEQNGQHYWFVDAAQFQTMVNQNEFVEWAQVHGEFYGTSRLALKKQIQQGDALLEIDYQGAFQIRQHFEQATLIFVLPPSFNALQRRLKNRAEDTVDTMALRLRNAQLEMQQAVHFDYIVINDLFEEAVLDLQAIIRTQHLRFQSQYQSQTQIFSELGISLS
jgi:guanylate kinase